MENIFYRRIEMESSLPVDVLKERMRQNTYPNAFKAIRDLGFGIPVLVLEGKFKNNAFVITPYITGSKGATPVVKGLITTVTQGKVRLSMVYRPSNAMIQILCASIIIVAIGMHLTGWRNLWPAEFLPVVMLYFMYSCQKAYQEKTKVMLGKMLRETGKGSGKGSELSPGARVRSQKKGEGLARDL